MRKVTSSAQRAASCSARCANRLVTSPWSHSTAFVASMSHAAEDDSHHTGHQMSGAICTLDARHAHVSALRQVAGATAWTLARSSSLAFSRCIMQY